MIKERILIFTRYPVPGETKTRLASKLGPVRAADVHRRLAERIFSTVKYYSTRFGAQAICCWDGGNEKKIRRWIRWSIPLWPQETGDIGKRMYLAFARAFKEGAGPVVLIGSDICDLAPSHFREAFESLKSRDLVLGPSLDGGYWLVGMKRRVDVFKGIHWSTEKVFQQTLDLAARSGLTVHSMRPLADIDTPEDLKKKMPGETAHTPYVSVVIPTLNEERCIQTAIQSARDPEAEIIVADGGSSDRTVEIARDSGATVVTGPRGRALQQNLGACHAVGRVLLFLHADSRLPEKYASFVFDVLMDPATVLGAFTFKTAMNDRILMKIFETGVRIRSSILGLPYGDQGLFVRREVFSAVGGFPSVPIAEDLLFVRRMSAKGKIAVATAPVITSARRWRRVGMLRTFFINQVILGACLIGVSPNRLAPLYESSRRTREKDEA